MTTEAIPFGGLTGLYALPEMVGRKDDIDRAIRELCGGEKQVVFVFGKAGIGKTRFLKEIRDRAKEKDVHVVDDAIDLYHTRTHTSNGLAEAIYQESSFMVDDELVQAVEELWRLWISGVGRDGAEQRQKHLGKFDEILESVCCEKPVLLLLDTAERLVYGLPALPEPLRTQVADSWEWLLNLLCKHPRLCLVIAGRPEADMLLPGLRERLGAEKVDEITLKPLSEKEGVQYFEKVRELAVELANKPVPETLDEEEKSREREKKKQAQEVVGIIDGYPDELRNNAAEWSKGVPITLSLIIYLLVSGGALPKDVDDPQAWEAKFFEKLLEIGTFGETLFVLGQLRKGGSIPLLADLLSIEEGDAAEKLAALEAFALTKVLDVPGVGKRYFLHDAIYEFLDRHNSPYDDDKPIHQTLITEYYDKQRLQWREHIKEYYFNIEDGAEKSNDDYVRWLKEYYFGIEEGAEKTDADLVRRLYEEKHALLTEDVYYSFRRNPHKGFVRRIRYTRDADLSGDLALDYALQAELLTFLGEEDPKGERQDIDAIGRDQFLGVLAMRPVVRAWVEADYDKATHLAGDTSEQMPDQFSEGSGNKAILNTWEAYARTMKGGALNLQKARELLDEAIEFTETRQNEFAEDAVAWRSKAILAFSHRVRGYLLDNQEQLKEAIDDYREAARLWRPLNVQVEEATTRNDLGFNLARIGEFDDAEDMIEDALEFRRNLGTPARVALSLSTLAEYHVYAGKYTEAQQFAARSLRLAENIQYKRGMGLAERVYAEAIRRKTNAQRAMLPEERIDALQQARSHAERSVKFSKELQEEWRVAAAMIELGCALRDMVKVCVENKDACSNENNLDVGALEGQSEKTLREAAEKASAAGYPTLQLDALVNLGWLGLYANDPTLSESARVEVVRAFREFFDANEQPLITRKNKDKVAIWEQLGKLYVMLGEKEYRDSVDSEKRNVDKLKQAGRLYTQAFQCSNIKGDQYPKFRLAKKKLYDELKKLNVVELGTLAEGVIEAEREFGWEKESAMRVFLQNRTLWYGKEE